LSAARQICSPLSLKPVYARNLYELITLLREQRIDHTGAILYDASPTPFHIQNLPLAHLWNMYYLGEKPIAVHEEQLHVLKDTHEFFCDFIETENEAFYTLDEFIKRNRLQITSLKFWRHSSTAFKLMRRERAGVEGGALLD